MSVSLASRFSVHASGRPEIETMLRDWGDIVAGNAAVAGISGLVDFLSEEPSPEPGYALYGGRMVLRVTLTRGGTERDVLPLAEAALDIAAARQRRRSPGLQVQFSEIEIA